MIRTPLTWLVGALAAAVLAAGCGSSSSTSSSTAGSAPAAATTPAATTTPATASTPAGAPGGASAAGVAQAVAACRSVAQRAPGLSASTKAKVESVCSKAEHGDLAGARAAASEVCTEVINASAIPSADKQSALQACKASGG